MYSSNYYDSSSALTGLAVGVVVLIIIVGIIALAVSVFMLICNYKMYKKAGKNGWEAIVPFYNTWVLVEIAGLNWWWFLIIIAPTIIAILGIPVLSQLAGIATMLGNVAVWYNISKKLKQETGFLILLVLVPIVAIPMIAFKKEYQFDNSVEVNPNAFFGGNTNQATVNNANVNNQTEANNASKFCTNCGTKVSSDEKFCTNCGTKL